MISMKKIVTVEQRKKVNAYVKEIKPENIS